MQHAPVLGLVPRGGREPVPRPHRRFALGRVLADPWDALGPDELGRCSMNQRLGQQAIVNIAVVVAGKRGGDGSPRRYVHRVRGVEETARETHANRRGDEAGGQIPLQDDGPTGSRSTEQPYLPVARSVALIDADETQPRDRTVVPDGRGAGCDRARDGLPGVRPQLLDGLVDGPDDLLRRVERGLLDGYLVGVVRVSSVVMAALDRQRV